MLPERRNHRADDGPVQVRSAAVVFPAVEFDHLIYARVFEGCNLYCKHCFVPHNPKRMDLEAVSRIPKYARQVAAPGSRILVQWHGGEPTVFGADWLRRAIDAVEREGAEMTWLHGIQTNLMSYDDGWRDLYRDRFRGHAGVSWDPKIRLLHGSNEDYEKRFWTHLERLLADDIEPYLVVTVTKVFVEQFRNPIDFFELLHGRGVRMAHLERLTRTGHARKHWDEIGLTNAEYSAAMSRIARAYLLWQRSLAEGEAPLRLSPFDGLFQAVEHMGAHEQGGYGCWSGQCDTRFHTVDADGYKAACTALTSEPTKDGTSVIRFHPATDRQKRQEPCQSCEFRKICSSGCLATPYGDGSGECSGSRSLFQTIRALNERYNTGGRC